MSEVENGRDRVALYGGSFDPPHLGHRKLVSFYLKTFPDVFKFLVVPNKISPFKRDKYFAPDDCLELTRLNFSNMEEGNQNIQVLDIETKKDSPSFTYETLLEVKNLFPGKKVDLIIGEDQLLDLPKWKEFSIIREEADRFVVFRRQTDPGDTIPIPNELFNAKIHICENPLWEESSSAWRRWPSSRDLFPKVRELVQSKSSSFFHPDYIESWKKRVKEEVSSSRYEHVLRVAKIAKELALTHDYLFPEKMELAGILHDITKQRPIDYHIEMFKKFEFTDYYYLPQPAYHAYSAKFLLMELGLEDLDILNSVASHTLGGKNMTMAEAILYSSDFLGSEYAIRQKEYPEWMTQIAHRLSFGLYLKSKGTIEDLLQKKKMIHQATFDVYNEALELLNQE